MDSHEHLQQLDAWIDAHFDEQVRFLQELIRVPTDTPPGNNAPHAERTAELLHGMGLMPKSTPCPRLVQAAGLETITNLIVRRKYGAGQNHCCSMPMATWCHPAKAGPRPLWRRD
jgi:succinyl-diaminopimelate desuccinylase